MNITKSFSKAMSAVGSLGGLAADAIEGTIDLGSKAKNAVDNEINSLQSERDIVNAVSRIQAKATAIRVIMDELHCSATEAEDLLIKELKRGNSNENF